MKYLLSLIIVFCSCSAFSQISFVNNIGTPKWSAFTILMDYSNFEKSKIYYCANDCKPSELKMVKDTTLNNIKFGIITIGDLPNKYLIALDGLNTIYLYSDKMQLIGNYKNDSKSYAASVKPAGLTPQQLLNGLKILAMFL